MRMLIDTEEFKHKLNNSKYYGTEVWDDICNMLSDCTSYTLNSYEDEIESKYHDSKYCKYYTTRTETRFLSDAEMCIEISQLCSSKKFYSSY